MKKLHLERSKPMTTSLIANEKLCKNDGNDMANALMYRSLIVSLLYLVVTRPDIMFFASLSLRFIQKPSQVHLGAPKRVLKYIRGIINFELLYLKKDSEKLVNMLMVIRLGVYR